ncbi:GNAT family N-acetyltransferase [Microbacterium luteolum]|jgi:GNAT superfamily N-acetyltransferase|uniref:GNAT family N-acetyltransferase n=1 Tax=Microbacterium luteolum TaxID=69367 RepID=A0ABY7XQ63_MICLT|nr:GNAT family N-acetyltransferase [Microbacterium luteolum]WDM44229.1 GNAT family N-acetyltransferase [Microbacterium luteolum]
MLDALPLPHPIDSRLGEATVRRATPNDADAVIALLADDPISAARGDVASEEDRPAYVAGLVEILADPSNDLLVAELDGVIVGTLQLTSIPGMARRGARRLLVEAVRVRSDLRSSGIGSGIMRWVSDSAAPALGAAMVQLTSDASRIDAHRFYEHLGYVGSHKGFKFAVPQD